MSKILIGATGSVAAIKTPDLVRALRAAGHEIKVVATQPALYFLHTEELPPQVLLTDDDEWPRRHTELTWQRTDPVLHIELRRWADLLLVAPLDANTLAKFALGLCDNCLTCVWRAWDLSRPIILAPAMNTLMWQNPLTSRHLRSLAELWQLTPPPDLSADQLVEWINRYALPRLTLAGPIEKTLACGDLGMGAMAEVDLLVQTVQRILSSSPTA
jgi:phosphopantothenoylcysteine decarboxylase